MTVAGLMPNVPGPLDSSEAGELWTEKYQAGCVALYLRHWLEGKQYNEGRQYCSQMREVIESALNGYCLMDETAQQPGFRPTLEGLRHFNRAVQALCDRPVLRARRGRKPEIREIGEFLLKTLEVLRSYNSTQRPKPDQATIEGIARFFDAYADFCRQELHRLPFDDADDSPCTI